jgi:predicted amidohydrolase
MPARIAVIQKPPVRLDLDGTIAKAIKAIDEADASLLVFQKRGFPAIQPGSGA